MHIFLSGSGGTGKYHLVTVIYNTISKTLLYHYKDLEKSMVFLLGPKGISKVNIGGSIIHSDLGIKPETKLPGLNGKSKAFLRNMLSEIKL